MVPTEDRNPADKLTDRQLEAIALIERGCTITETAATISVSRQTVSNWYNNVSFFRTEIDERRWQRYTASKLVRVRIDHAALTTVLSAVSDGDVSAALRWLKLRNITKLEDPAEDPFLTEFTDEEIDSMIRDAYQNLTSDK